MPPEVSLEVGLVLAQVAGALPLVLVVVLDVVLQLLQVESLEGAERTLVLGHVAGRGVLLEVGLVGGLVVAARVRTPERHLQRLTWC